MKLSACKGDEKLIYDIRVNGCLFCFSIDRLSHNLINPIQCIFLPA